ncbi:MAG: hypothetical protein ACLRZH_06790 [Ruthenibacterium lactatiformans]
MDHCNLYTDIATRTGGDIYIGVVGPCHEKALSSNALWN